jgi:hypothetical protein
VAPQSPDICDPDVTTTVRALAAAATAETDVLEQSISTFDKSIRCITRSGRSEAFGGHKPPSGGEVTALKKILGRIAKAKGG